MSAVESPTNRQSSGKRQARSKPRKSHPDWACRKSVRALHVIEKQSQAKFLEDGPCGRSFLWWLPSICGRSRIAMLRALLDIAPCRNGSAPGKSSDSRKSVHPCSRTGARERDPGTRRPGDDRCRSAGTRQTRRCARPEATSPEWRRRYQAPSRTRVPSMSKRYTGK